MYVFQVKQRERSKVLSAFHILIGLIFVLDLSHVHGHEKKDWVFSGAYLLASIFIFAAGIFQKKILRRLSAHLSLLLFESALVFCGAIYFWTKGVSLVSFSHGILAGIIILFWIYLKRRVSGETIVISEKNIIVPGLSGDRIIHWNELVNVVKKYDLLTLDFKNNKLLQVQVVNADDIAEDDFNKFCKMQIA